MVDFFISGDGVKQAGDGETIAYPVKDAKGNKGLIDITQIYAGEPEKYEIKWDNGKTDYMKLEDLTPLINDYNVKQRAPQEEKPKNAPQFSITGEKFSDDGLSVIIDVIDTKTGKAGKILHKDTLENGDPAFGISAPSIAVVDDKGKRIGVIPIEEFKSMHPNYRDNIRPKAAMVEALLDSDHNKSVSKEEMDALIADPTKQKALL